MENSMKDFLCGTISGFSQVLVMQPFEIIKIRLVNQSNLNPQYLGILDCFNKIRCTQGLLSFFKGSASPLLGIGPQVALQFATNQFVKRAIQKLNSGQSENNALSFKEALASGFLTGIPSAFLVTPIDLTRIQMQIKDSNRYHSSIHAAKSILREKGIRGLYLGFYPTLLREVIALSVYFGFYEHGKNYLMANNLQVGQELPLTASFMLGGFSGAASWLFTYPIDYLKTLIQSQSIKKMQFKSATHCMIEKYRQEGIRTFFKGLGVTMLRSYPVNGIGFAIFELTKRITGRQDQETA